MSPFVLDLWTTDLHCLTLLPLYPSSGKHHSIGKCTSSLWDKALACVLYPFFGTWLISPCSGISHSVAHGRNYSLWLLKRVSASYTRWLFFPAHQLRILRLPPHHVLRSLAFNMDMCMACLFDILIIFPWDRQIAIGGAAPSYASYIFNFLGTSTLFS